MSHRRFKNRTTSRSTLVSRIMHTHKTTTLLLFIPSKSYQSSQWSKHSTIHEQEFVFGSGLDTYWEELEAPEPPGKRPFTEIMEETPVPEPSRGTHILLAKRMQEQRPKRKITKRVPLTSLSQQLERCILVVMEKSCYLTNFYLVVCDRL